MMRAGPILIVDDDLDVREILAETLQDSGFDAITASNGFEALKLVRTMTCPPSIILLDLMMPVMDGYAFLEERQKDPTLASVPVAILTAGYGVDRGRLADGELFVPKPIDIPRLLGVLRDLRSTAEGPA